MINWIKEEQLVRHEDNEYENIMARVCIQTRSRVYSRGLFMETEYLRLEKRVSSPLILKFLSICNVAGPHSSTNLKTIFNKSLLRIALD